VLQGISNYHKPLPTIPWTQCRATLLVDGNPYTRAETFQLRRKWRESEFQGYLIDRWGLDAGDIYNINWAGYRLARNRMTLAVRTFSTKLLIGWLATGTRMEKYGNRLTDCHRCGGVETVDHLFRCPENRDLFNTFLTDLQSFLVLIKTKPAIMDDMVNGIQLWASEENASGFWASQRVTQRYRDSAQTRIGFNLLLRGILTSDWSERQQAYLIDVNGGVRGTEADTWSSKLSTWLINQAHDLWKARNEELHRPTAPDNSQIARAALELQERVRELYEQKDDVNYQDRDLFEIPLESRLQQSVSIMRAWVESTSKTLGICIEDFATATARGNSDIRDHLPIRARETASTPVAVQPEPTGSTRAAAATRERPEVHELVDTNSTDSTMNSSTSSASSGLGNVQQGTGKAKTKEKTQDQDCQPNAKQRPKQRNKTVTQSQRHLTATKKTGTRQLLGNLRPKPRPRKQSKAT
jgi:predicted Rdx family selenoprotein